MCAHTLTQYINVHIVINIWYLQPHLFPKSLTDPEQWETLRLKMVYT